MARCLSQVMKLSLLFLATIAAAGWALSESRPPRTHVDVKVETTPPPPSDVPRQARSAPPLPSRPLPPPLPAPPPPPKRPMVAKISGRIVDLDGNPHPDAKADLDLGDVCTWIYADADGHFTAELAPGTYTLVGNGGDDVLSPTLIVELRPGEETRDIVLELPARGNEDRSRNDDEIE